jgi:hypothetical protein
LVAKKRSKISRFTTNRWLSSATLDRGRSRLVEDEGTLAEDLSRPELAEEPALLAATPGLQASRQHDEEGVAALSGAEDLRALLHHDLLAGAEDLGEPVLGQEIEERDLRELLQTIGNGFESGQVPFPSFHSDHSLDDPAEHSSTRLGRRTRVRRGFVFWWIIARLIARGFDGTKEAL